MSRASFTSSFPKILGQTPLRYLTALRLVKAARQLRTTERTVTEIALDVGYSSQPPFSTAFRQHFGQSPREYRNNHTTHAA